ncbi:hypothetical protein LZC95_39220 [Pendulispora brunnea]|uniref:Uncharacterized protein n=1 Tax=Pendulispora brunnea TaxID=2905690 RepID=A0ABZ2K6M8_9BACT
MALRSGLVALSLSALSALSIAALGIPAVIVTTSSVAHAEAEDSANVEILVLHATQQAGAGAIDPSIGNLPQLKKPPFSSFNTYKLLDRKGITLKKGQPIEYALVDGRKLNLVLLEKTPKPERYRLAASIDASKGEAFLKKIEVTASPNEPFFVAGQSHKGGILVLGIAIKGAGAAK